MTLYTFLEARHRFRETLKEYREAICPCCDRKAFLYKRRLNRGMVAALVRLYRVQKDTGKAWVHISEFDPKRSDFPVLQHWGVIESRGDHPDDDHAKVSGYWRVTTFGQLFVQQELRLSQYVEIYDGVKQTSIGPEVSVSDVLGAFRYHELLAKEVPTCAE